MDTIKEVIYRKTKNEYSMTLILLALMSFAMLTLLLMGQNLNFSLSNSIHNQNNIRYTAEYITDTIRQNDAAGKLFLSENNFGPGFSLTINESTADAAQYRWIYYTDGKLYEVITDADIQPGYENGEVISELSSFAFLYEPENKTMVIEFSDSGLTVHTQTILLRSSIALVTGGKDG